MYLFLSCGIRTKTRAYVGFFFFCSSFWVILFECVLSGSMCQCLDLFIMIWKPNTPRFGPRWSGGRERGEGVCNLTDRVLFFICSSSTSRLVLTCSCLGSDRYKSEMLHSLLVHNEFGFQTLSHSSLHHPPTHTHTHTRSRISPVAAWCTCNTPTKCHYSCCIQCYHFQVLQMLGRF